MSTNAYCGKWDFITLIGKLDVNPTAVRQLDIPNPSSSGSAALYRNTLDPSSTKFKNIATSVGYTGDLTKNQIDEVSQVAFAYRYADGITATAGSNKALLSNFAKKIVEAGNKTDIEKIISGDFNIKYRVEKGIKSVMDSGPLAGFPVIDFKVVLVDGKFHDVDSSVLAFEIAARMGMREGMREAGAKLLEPIMKVEVVTPEEYTGNIIGDLTSRRGQIQGQEPRGNAIAIECFVPLANMFGYINNLRSMSSGRANFTMQFDHMSQYRKIYLTKFKLSLLDFNLLIVNFYSELFNKVEITAA
jgi:elongation factor G